KLVGPAENAPDVAQRHIGRIIGVGTGRTMGQDFPQLPPKSLLMQKVRPHHHAAMGGQPLIGKRNPNGRSVIFGVNWQAHRLVRLPSRFGNLIWFHHHKPAKRCSLFQAESFRLRPNVCATVGAHAGLQLLTRHSPPNSDMRYTKRPFPGPALVMATSTSYSPTIYGLILTIRTIAPTRPVAVSMIKPVGGTTTASKFLTGGCTLSNRARNERLGAVMF